MFNKSSKGPLIVELMDISKQNEAILKFFISGVGSKVFNIASVSTDVEAYIIDYDFPGAKAHWNTAYADDNKPRIILSTTDPRAANSVWVGKPLSSKKLIEAAAQIKELLKHSPIVTTPSISNDNGEEEMPEKPEPKVFSLANEIRTVLPKKNTAQEKEATVALVSSEQLEQENIETTNDNLDHTIDRSQSEVPPNKEKIKTPKTQEQLALEAEQLEKRWKELCGENEDTSTHKADELRYVPENYFIGKLIGAVRLAKQSQQIVEIKSPTYSVCILPKEHLIFTQLVIDDKNFIAFSRNKIKQGEVNFHILSSIETGKLELNMSKQPEYIHSLESFLWTSSLLASKGRLPITVDMSKRTALKYWPSFARIEAFPYSMRIAALWHHSPDTLVEMSQKLEIPQRYVFAFYNGADALGLIEHDAKKVKQQIKAKPKKKGGGLLTRLFNRLLKGGATSS
jgi:hypothetical protein